MPAPQILIVEDECITALALSETLSRLGYEVAGAHSSGEAALKHISERPPDLVLMDIQLAGAIDGIETARRIPPALMVPVIYLSAAADDSILRRASATKPYGYVIKPASEGALHAAIEMAMERRATDLALRQSEQRLQLALEAAELGLWEMDPETEHILHSEHLGWTSDAQPRIVTQRFRDFLATVCEEDRETVLQALEGASNNGLAREIEFRRATPEGTFGWHRIVARAVEMPTDRRRRIIGVSRDVTHAKLAAEELRAADRDYRELISTINGIIWEIDRERDVLTYISDSVQRLLGYTPAEWLADPLFWETHIHQDDRARALTEYQGARESGRPYMSTYRMIAKDGQPVWIHEVVSAPTRIGRKSILRGVMVDITTIKKAEADLQRNEQDLRKLLSARERAVARAVAANQAKSSFLAVMSHELRTPLNAILGFSDLMRSEIAGSLGSPVYKNYAEDIHQAGALLLGIINNILDLSRIESGRLELKMERLCLADIWARIGSTVHGQAAAKGIVLRFLEPETQSWFHADGSAISQILINLVANAIKFTPSGGVVEVGEEPASGDVQVVLFVRDNGRGIPADKIKDVQKPFVQVSDSYVRDVGGVGLGLAICRSLADAMRGRLRITSKLGKGTTVRVLLTRFDESQAIRQSA